MKTSRPGLQNSLLTSALAHCALLVVIIVAAAAMLAFRHERNQIGNLATVLTGAVSAAGQSLERPAALQHYLDELGRHDAFPHLVIVTGAPAVVVASSNHAEIGLPADALDDRTLADALSSANAYAAPLVLAEVLSGGIAVHPLHFEPAGVDPSAPTPGAIGIRFDEDGLGNLAPIELLIFAGLTASALLGVSLLYQRVLGRRVIEPLEIISAAVARERAEGSTPPIILGRDDELQDIADQINATFDVLREQRIQLQRLAKVAEETSNPILITAADGTIEWGNDAFVAASGYRLEEVRGRHVRVLLPESIPTRMTIGARWAEALEGRPTSFQTTLQTRNGTLFAGAVGIHPLLDGNRKPYSMVIVAENIATRREAEREAAALVLRLQEQVASDLHDLIGGQLGGLAFHLKTLNERLAREYPAAAADAAALMEVVTGLSEQTRSLSHLLFPVSRNLGSLPEILDRLCVSTSRQGTTCTLVHSGALPPLPAWEAQLVYLIAQEAIRNALLHGKAPRIRVALSAHPDCVSLQVTSRGAPFKADPTKSGIGLEIMAFRADLLNAAFVVRARPRGILSIRLVVPIHDDAAESERALRAQPPPAGTLRSISP